MRAEDEDKRFSLREISKSPSTAITVIIYFRTNLKNLRKPLRRDRLDLITSAIHMHGKVYPEIYFFGIDCLRENLELVDSEWRASSAAARKDTAAMAAVSDLIAQILPLAIQFSINAIDFFLTKDSYDYLVFSAFHFLMLLGAKFDDFIVPAFSTSVAKSFGSLMDLLVNSFLVRLGPETCSTVVGSIAVFSSLVKPTDVPNVFFRKYFFDFSCDIVNRNESDDESSSVRDMRVYSLMYISSILKTADGKRETVMEKIFASPPTLIEQTVAELVPLLNQRFALSVMLGFISTVVNSGLKHLSHSSPPSNEEEGIGGLLFSAISESVGSNNFSFGRNFDEIVAAIDIEILDDVFTAYMEDGGASDGEIVVLLNSIGIGLVEYFCSFKKSSSSVTVGISVIRKWAVTSVASESNPFIVSSGIELAATISQYGNERFENIIGFDALESAISLMVSRSVSWAGDQVMGSLRHVVTEELAGRVFIHLNFHPQMFMDEKWKIFFFKKFSIKEIFLRVVSVMNWICDIRDLHEVARVSCQMIVAMKSKSVWQDIQAEIVMIESERFRTGGRTGGFFTWFLCALEVSRDNWDTTQLVLFIFSETFLKTENVKQDVPKIVEGIVRMLRQDFREKAASILLGSGGPKYKPGGLGTPSGELRPVRTVLGNVIAMNTTPTDVLLEEKREKEKVKDEPGKATVAEKSEPGWADSAASWFLDMTEGKSGDESDEDKKDTEEHHEEVQVKESEKVREPVELAEPEETVIVPKVGLKIAPKAPSVVVKSPAKLPPGKQPIGAKPGMVMKPGMAGKPGMVMKPGMIGKPGMPTKYAVPPKTGMVKVPMTMVPKKAIPAPPPPVPEVHEEDADPPQKKEKKKKKVEEEGWGEYLGGLWGGAVEEPKEKKKKKKKKDEDDDNDEEEKLKKPAVQPKMVKLPAPTAVSPKGGVPKKAIPKPVAYPIKSVPKSPPPRR